MLELLITHIATFNIQNISPELVKFVSTALALAGVRALMAIPEGGYKSMILGFL